MANNIIEGVFPWPAVAFAPHQLVQKLLDYIGRQGIGVDKHFRQDAVHVVDHGAARRLDLHVRETQVDEDVAEDVVVCQYLGVSIDPSDIM